MKGPSSRAGAKRVAATQHALVVSSAVYASLMLRWVVRKMNARAKQSSALTATGSPALLASPTPALPREVVAAQRCPTCLTNWPLGKEFLRCPRDGDRTLFRSGEEPISPEEAALALPVTEAELERFTADIARWDGTIPT